jgi:hypothetical protein
MRYTIYGLHNELLAANQTIEEITNELVRFKRKIGLSKRRETLAAKQLEDVKTTKTQNQGEKD